MFKNVTNLQILQFIVICVGCLFAWYAGGDIADENFIPIAAAVGFLLFILIYFSLGTSIYYLIPIFWVFTGSISMLPVPLSVRQLLIIIASISFIFGYIFKTNRSKATFRSIDFWIWLNLVWLAQAFFRNPVGFAFLGGGARVGGKPYVDVLIGVMAYLILSRFRISSELSKKLPYWMFAATLLQCLITGFATVFPTLSMHLAPLYSDFNSVMNGVGMENVSAGETRLGFLGGLGSAICFLLVCQTDPTELLNPNNLGKSLLYLSGVFMVLLSGFRNDIMGVFQSTVLAAFVRGRTASVVNLILGACFVAVLAIGISYCDVKLPFTFQRALSFLPGHWDQDAVEDAKGSSEWRFEMWRLALTTDRYIHNKLLGDGFGFLREDYEIAVDAMVNHGAGFGGENAGQEAFMLDGDLHSGPVSSIRFVGYVGLGLFLPLLVVLAWTGFQLIKKTKGTPFQLVGFYIGIPVLLWPIWFVFIFGDYRDDFQSILFTAGIINMLTASLEQYQRTQISTNEQKTVGIPEQKNS
jgi:hypothetical protein